MPILGYDYTANINGTNNIGSVEKNYVKIGLQIVAERLRCATPQAVYVRDFWLIK